MTKLTPFVSTLIVLTACSLIAPHSAAADQKFCSEQTCDKCLRESSCVWMHNGTCAQDCDNFPDSDCYYPRMFGSPQTNRFEICEVERDLYADNHRCFQKQDERSCRDEIGCVWLNGVQKSGKVAFWCALHLESASLHQHHKKTYPPTEPAIAADEEDIHDFHAKTSSVVESVLGAYALLPFCFWACWWGRVKLRERGDDYDEEESLI
jgi:hypothetical protein